MANPFNNLITERILGVGEAFFSAKDKFNSKDWDKLVPYLDPNVVVYNISNVAYVAGIDKVMKYFRSIKDEELFEPTNDMSLFPQIYPLSVRGTALWTHAAHNHVQVPIGYEFGFAPSSFLITYMWAAHSR